MYYILGFVAFVLGVVFIWTVGNNDYGSGYYFFEIRVAVVFVIMAGLFALAKKLSWKANRREKSVQAGFIDKDEGLGVNDGKDLYLISKRDGEEFHYRVEDGEKEAFYYAVGELNQGRVDSIELSGRDEDAGAAVLVARSQSAKDYTVREGEQVLGTIKVRKGELRFAGADGTSIYSTSFADEYVPEDEAAVEGILRLIALRPVSHGPKANTVLIKDAGDEVVGKYFFPLRNLELTGGGNSAGDRRIEMILTIMTDIRLQVAEGRKRA